MADDLFHVSIDSDGQPHEAMCLVCSSIWLRLGLSGYPNAVPFDHFRRKHEVCAEDFAGALDSASPSAARGDSEEG